MSLFVVSLGKFIKHNFIYSWQAHQFKNCISDFPNDVVVSVVDFAENYTFKQQNEIQSMHWCSVQVTIFVHITYFRVSGEILKKSFISLFLMIRSMIHCSSNIVLSYIGSGY